MAIRTFVMMQFWHEVKLFEGLIHHWDFDRRRKPFDPVEFERMARVE